jgi:hypothetical protein
MTALFRVFHNIQIVANQMTWNNSNVANDELVTHKSKNMEVDIIW